MNEFLIGLGIKKVALVAGLIGGVVSLRFFEGLTFSGKLATATGGAAIANFVTDPAMLYFNLPNGYEGGIGFLFGLFGMSVGAAVIKTIKTNGLIGITGRSKP